MLPGRDRGCVRRRGTAPCDLDVDRALVARPRRRAGAPRRSRVVRRRSRDRARRHRGERRSAPALRALRVRRHRRVRAAPPRLAARGSRAAPRAMRELDERIERAVGAAPVRYEKRGGGYSSADRFSVQLDDGRRVFVKSAEAENLAGWLRREHEVYTGLSGGFIPGLEGWDDDGSRPVLAIEDLSDADWTPRWDRGRITAVRAALSELAAAVPPPGTAPVRESFAELFGRWETVAADPEPFLSSGVRDRAWLDRSLDRVVDAAARAPVDGDAVCHFDVRSDNLCFRDGRGVLVDWNWVSLGNPDLDVAA